MRGTGNGSFEGVEFSGFLLMVSCCFWEYFVEPIWPNVSLREAGAVTENASTGRFRHIKNRLKEPKN
jgi:hypothetical protein